MRTQSAYTTALYSHFRTSSPGLRTRQKSVAFPTPIKRLLWTADVQKNISASHYFLVFNVNLYLICSLYKTARILAALFYSRAEYCFIDFIISISRKCKHKRLSCFVCISNIKFILYTSNSITFVVTLYNNFH